MAFFARDVYTASASQTDFTITFPYLEEDHVVVTVDGVEQTVTTDYTFFSATVIRLVVAATGGEIVVLTRKTSHSVRLVDYTAGTLTEADLDRDNLQNFYMCQEAIDIANTKLGLDTTENWDAESKRIKNVADPTAAQDAATRAYVLATLASAAGVTAGTNDEILTYDSGTGGYIPEAIGSESGVQAFDADTAKTDVAQTYTAAQRSGIIPLSDGATITPDFTGAGNDYSVTLGGNRTMANPTNQVAGQSGVIEVTQDGTGSRTLSFGANWNFEGGTAPTMSTAAGAVDLIVYWVKASGTIHARVILDLQ